MIPGRGSPVVSPIGSDPISEEGLWQPVASQTEIEGPATRTPAHCLGNAVCGGKCPAADPGTDCFGDSTQSFVRFQYQGEGKGGYEKVPQYTFVGQGKGSFQREVLDKPYGSQPHWCCLCCLMAMVLFLGTYLWSLFVKDGELPSMTSLDIEDHNCEALVSALEAGSPHAFSEDKDWCCKHRDLGCEAGAAEPFNCERGYDDWHHLWQEKKKVYCCKMYARGCKAAEVTTTTEPFDCLAGLSEWQAAWSRTKQLYCCTNHHRGCTMEAPV